MNPTDPKPLAGVDGVKPLSPAPASNPAEGAAFKALLEKLEEGNRRMAAAAAGVESPGDLAGAVSDAGRSVQQALDLGDELLEAYRASQQNPPESNTDTVQ